MGWVGRCPQISVAYQKLNKGSLIKIGSNWYDEKNKRGIHWFWG